MKVTKKQLESMIKEELGALRESGRNWGTFGPWRGQAQQATSPVEAVEMAINAYVANLVSRGNTAIYVTEELEALVFGVLKRVKETLPERVGAAMEDWNAKAREL